MTQASLRPVTALAAAHVLEAFDSGAPALDRWLKHSAHTAAAAGTAATYVLCRDHRVVGYYALAMSAIAHDRAPSRPARGMPDPVPVVLLARLALDRSEHGDGLGGHLLVDALARCVRGARQFGARAVIVEATNHAAADFYRHFGFQPLAERVLWRRISDIERALEAGASAGD